MEYVFFDPGTKEDQGRIEPKPKKQKKTNKKTWKIMKKWDPKYYSFLSVHAFICFNCLRRQTSKKKNVKTGTTTTPPGAPMWCLLPYHWNVAVGPLRSHVSPPLKDKNTPSRWSKISVYRGFLKWGVPTYPFLDGFFQCKPSSYGGASIFYGNPHINGGRDSCCQLYMLLKQWFTTHPYFGLCHVIHLWWNWGCILLPY